MSLIVIAKRKIHNICIIYIIYKYSFLFSGVFSCCNGDTWASELGTVFSNSDPILITNLKKVPKGTNGGISVVGTVSSAVGGLLIGISQYLVIFYFSDRTLWMYAPPQWPIIVFGALGGLLGSLIDSFLGATVQYSGEISCLWHLIFG